MEVNQFLWFNHRAENIVESRWLVRQIALFHKKRHMEWENFIFKTIICREIFQIMQLHNIHTQNQFRLRALACSNGLCMPSRTWNNLAPTFFWKSLYICALKWYLLRNRLIREAGNQFKWRTWHKSSSFYWTSRPLPEISGLASNERKQKEEKLNRYY